MPTSPNTVYVDHLPDLMTWDDYAVTHERKLVRFQLKVTDQGLEILGDSPYPHLLEALRGLLHGLRGPGGPVGDHLRGVPAREPVVVL